jgi:hypothetical protein
MGIEAAQRRALGALLEHHPVLISADQLRADLADVHDIDPALTGLIRDGLVMRFGELIGASWVAVRTHRLHPD